MINKLYEKRRNNKRINKLYIENNEINKKMVIMMLLN